MKRVFLRAIDFYDCIKWLFPACCKFIPSCSQYAREAFKKYPLLKALKLTLLRLLKCHPFSPGGIDYLE
ncbi:MAG: membrane protein insertion efficiency factor YidD [Candidatus Omnitrophica bacterium]|nr:membrane protein insertion efficiency factor YidD [Candidatus Omnitrophota bacterium]